MVKVKGKAKEVFPTAPVKSGASSSNQQKSEGNPYLSPMDTINALNGDLDFLFNQFETLRAKLHPVISPASCGSGQESLPAHSEAPLHVELIFLRNRIITMQNYMSNLLGEVDL